MHDDAGYLMIRGAGGIVLDFKGGSFDQQVYGFDAKYAMVAATTEELGRDILGCIRQ